MRPFTTWMLALAICAAPSINQAANHTPASEASPVQLRNVQLTEDGLLHGQVLTESGKPGLATIKVHSQKDAKSVAQVVRTDENGHFEVKGLQSGQCVFTVGEDTFACRVWNHNMAPPKSLQTIAVVPTTGVVLGQNCNTCPPPRPGLCGRLACMSGAQKALLVGLVAAAIIIPIALDDDDDKPDAS